jgi:hypothetical protein
VAQYRHVLLDRPDLEAWRVRDGVLRDFVRDGTRDAAREIAVARRRIAVTRPGRASHMGANPVGLGNHSVQAPFQAGVSRDNVQLLSIHWLEGTRP